MSFKNLTLSPNNCIVELEMFYEKKQIYGPRSSVSIYSKYLGLILRILIYTNFYVWYLYNKS